MAFETIQNAENGFATITASWSAAPLFPFFKDEGFAKDGIKWDDVENKTFDIGADGIATKNTKPVLYTGTRSYKPNSACRAYFDAIIAATSVSFGKKPASIELILTVNNYLTGKKTIYSGGDVTTFQAGDSADLDNGQTDKAYKFTFTSRVEMPL